MEVFRMIQFLGPTGTRLRRALPAAILFAMLASLVVTLPALAVHDTGKFQLDGDASSLTQPPSPYPQATDDWDKVCHQYANPAEPSCLAYSNTSGATSGLWANDGSLNASIFTGGGSKDPQDISNWAWKDAGGLPDKDNLLHAFAVRYSLPTALSCPSPTPTCDVIYFGSDRLDNSGDAQQGFWFLQNNIGLGSNSVGGGSGFTGVHKNGDILVISDFSNGGTTSTITVYQWDSTVSGNLRLMETSTSANCSTVPAGDSFCGIVNSITITMPWSFTDKSGTPKNGALNGEFYEAGINLSAIGLGGECFSNMVAETRSSTSTTATLKDFVLGTFGKCTSGIVTTPSISGSTPIGTGGSLSGVTDKAVVTVTGASSFGGTVTFHLCGPADLAPNQTQSTCDTSGTLIGLQPKPVSPPSPRTVTSDSATITSAGNYCWRADYSGDSVAGVPASSDSSSTECFTVTPMTPTLTTKAGTSPVSLGSAITDTAKLNGTANEPGSTVINPITPGGAAAGTITFTLVGPDCSSVPSGFLAIVVNVSGDSNTAYTASFTPTAAGVYTWKAVYSGDLPNTLGASATACPDANEAVTVQAQPTISTAQTFTVKDSATISATSGGDLAGTLRFRLYPNGDCGGTTTLVDQSFTNISGPSPLTRETTPVTITTSQTTLSWLVEWSNTNPLQKDVTSTCATENASLSINNGS
jgi:hypothetical protein